MASSDDAVDDIFLPDGKLRTDAVHDSAIRALHEAIRYARSTHWDSVRSPHLFMGLLAAPDAGIRSWAESLPADLPRLLEQFAELFHQEDGECEAYLSLNREFLSDNVIKLLRDAYQRAADHDRQMVPLDILISLFTTQNSIVAQCFEHLDFTAAKLTELAVIAERECQSR